MKTQKGFTLVELAIVLMIIGLLIAGVLRGQEMLNNARVSNTIKQVTSYGGAYHTFMDAYNAEPGDMLTAMNRIPGCQTGNTNSCQNGDGNSILGAQVNIYVGGQHGITTENTQFWKHLALAHLISGVDPSAATPVWGKSHPTSIFPGGFTIVSSLGGGGVKAKLALRLHGCLSCANAEQTASGSGSPVSPKQASQIDRKMDDGIPNSGDVQAAAYGNGAVVADCEAKYNEAREDAFCVMGFALVR